MDKHDKYEVVKQAWFEINEHLRNNKQDYIEYLKFSSKMYKQPYSDAVLVFQQDRNATKIAEYKKWGRLGRYVRRGSHGVAVFGKNHTCRYLYDVTQTGGKELPEMWTLTDRNTTELLNTLNNRYNINAGSVKECIEAMTANSINSAPIAESVQNAISQMGLDTKQAEVYRHSLDSVVQFVVSQRCNLSGKINLHADVDVSALDLIKNARDMILFSRAVQHAAKDTLFEIEKEVIAIDRKNEALDNAKTAKQESTSDRVDDILQDLIKLKFSQEQILALKQAVVAAAQNGEHNIQHWVSIRYSPDELQHISSLVADYYAQSVIEQTLDSKGILNDYYTYVNELNGRLKLSDMFSHHDYSDEQKAMLQQGFSEGISITVLNEVDERLTVDEIKTFFEMFHQAVDGQIDPHDVQIYLDKAVIEHSKQNVQAVEVQDNSVDTNSVGVVKQYDNDFYINHSEQKSQELSSYQRLHLPEAMNNLDSKEPIRHAAFTDKQLALSVLNDSNDSVSQNDNEVKTSAALSEPTITCEWSESNYFEDGKTYSVAEFDTLMEQADSEMVAGAKAAIEKYGSAKAWYEADADDEFSQFMGYDKVKFTINMPDGQTITERFELDKPCIAVLHGELTYSCDVATDNGVGNVRRIENLAGIQINQKQCSLEEQLEKANKDLSEAQQNMLKPFEHGQELAEKTKRLEYVNAQLSGNSQSINNAPESAVEFRFHNNKYQALIGTKNKSEWCDVVSKGGKLIAASDTKVYNLSEKESDQFRSYVFNGDKIDTGKNNSLLEKLKPKALKL